MTVFSDFVAKMETVLSTTIGFKLENLSAIDQNNWTANPLCQLLYQGQELEDNFNERPKPKNANFVIRFGFRHNDPATVRDKIEYWEGKIFSNMTVANINDTAKSVRFISHDQTTNDYSEPYVSVDCPITIRYRDS